MSTNRYYSPRDSSLLTNHYYLITVFSWILIRNMLSNNMYYFDEVTLTANVLRKKVV